jgi:hypothetical protein
MSAANDNSKIIMAGVLLFGAYMMMNRRAQVAYQPGQGGKAPYAVGTMPGSAGVGWEQVGVGALTGFLKGLASGVSNSSTGVTPSVYNQQQQTTDWLQSGTVQDAVFDPFSDAVSALWA